MRVQEWVWTAASNGGGGSSTMSSSTLATYSSGDEAEDEYGRGEIKRMEKEKRRKGTRQGDVNYEEVNMDVSEGEEDGGGPAGREAKDLFSSREEYKAYQEQFKGEGGRNRGGGRSREHNLKERGERGGRDSRRRRADEERRHRHHRDEGEEERDWRHHRGGDDRQRNRDQGRSGDRGRRSRDRDRDRDRHRDRHRDRSRSPRHQFERVSARDDSGHRDNRHHRHGRHGGRDHRDGDQGRRPSPNREPLGGGHGVGGGGGSGSGTGQSGGGSGLQLGKESGGGLGSVMTVGTGRQGPPGPPAAAIPPLMQQVIPGRHQLKTTKKLLGLGLMEQAAMLTGDTEMIERQRREQIEKIKETTGVEIPKYYNPTAINPLKFAEQIKKRQMLWKKPAGSGAEGSRDNAPSSSSASSISLSSPGGIPAGGGTTVQKQSFNKWESTNFGNEQANEKFRRLMGIRGGAGTSSTGASASSAPAEAAAASLSAVTSSESMFAAQEEQYERARAATHTMRGLGLGFSGVVAQQQQQLQQQQELQQQQQLQQQQEPEQHQLH